METVQNVANYVARKFEDHYGRKIDEMKLHKIMYFIQRESLIQTDEPMFDAAFYGWKFGPVLREVRKMFKDNAFSSMNPSDMDEKTRDIIDAVFDKYADRDSWSLSWLTHGEYSWQQSRDGIPEGGNGSRPMKLEDIRVDAYRIRDRREKLNMIYPHPRKFR